MFKKLISTSDDIALTILRLALGVVLFAHGAQKLLGWFGGFGFQGTKAAMSQVGVSASLFLLIVAIEFFGGLGLIFGFLTRIPAFGGVVLMIGAIVMFHFQNGFFMNWYGLQKGEGFEFHLLAMTISAALLLRGAGAFSVDRALSRN